MTPRLPSAVSVGVRGSWLVLCKMSGEADCTQRSASLFRLPEPSSSLGFAYFVSAYLVDLFVSTVFVSFARLCDRPCVFFFSFSGFCLLPAHKTAWVGVCACRTAARSVGQRMAK
jgi:hypothetical protein